MGWVLSVCVFISYAWFKDPMILIASGLFAIAGAIGSVSASITKNMEANKKDFSDAVVKYINSLLDK